jgi:hypothetical protein
MATAILKPQSRTSYDHLFFPTLAIFIAVTVFLGFAQTYYLHGILRVPAFKAVLAPPVPLIVHVHAILFSLWIIFLIMQTSLVAAHRVDLHRQLGVLGFGLAVLMVPVTIAAICAELVRLHSSRLPWGQIADITVFATLIYLACRQRRNSGVHKRQVLIATITLLDAPFARWPVLVAGNGQLANLCCYSLFLLMATYDLFSMGKVLPATLWGAVFSIISKYPVTYLLARHVRADWLVHQMRAVGYFLR